MKLYATVIQGMSRDTLTFALSHISDNNGELVKLETFVDSQVTLIVYRAPYRLSFASEQW